MARAKGARPFYQSVGYFTLHSERLKLTRSQAARVCWDPFAVRAELAASHGVPADDIDVDVGYVRYRGGERPGLCVDCVWFTGEAVPGTAHRETNKRWDGSSYDEVLDLCPAHAKRRRERPYGFGTTVVPLLTP